MAKTLAEKNQEKIDKLRPATPSTAFISNMNKTGTETKEEEKAKELVEETVATVQEKTIPESSEPEEASDVKPAPVKTEKKENTSGRQKQIKEQESKKTEDEEVKEDKSESKNSLLQELKAKGKKQRIEDTHTRCTFLVRNDLEKRVNAYAVGNFGFKTSFINFAIEAALDDYDKIYNEDDE